MRKPRLITRALQIVQQMEPARTRRPDGRTRISSYVCFEERYRELRAILTDLDARQSVVQPSRRSARGLKPRRAAARG